MSPNVGNFVHDLVEMAKAMEELPQVRNDLDQANKLNTEQGAVIASREESILKLKAEIETLNSRIRDAEVARDDAEFRFLELDEKATKATNCLKDVISIAQMAQDDLKPPPAPMPEPEPITAEDVHDRLYEPKVEAQGQSESHPTAKVASDTLVQSADQIEPVGQVSENTVTDKPYLDKFYFDLPVYVSLSDWLDGGGTEENYYRSKPRQE